MIRNLSKHISFFILTLLAAGCAGNAGTVPDVGYGKTVVITLNNITGSRSEESDNSETRIDNVFVALYPESPSEMEPAVVSQAFGGLDATGTATVRMRLTDDMVRQLFNGTSGASCRLYAVANVPDPASVPSTSSIAELKALSVGSEFDTRKVQDSFVMSGDGKVRYTLSDGKGSASGSAALARTAAKIYLNVRLPQSVEDASGAVWVPAVSADAGMRVFLINGVKTSQVSPGESVPGDDDYFIMSLVDGDVVRNLTDSGTGEYRYRMDVPLYTYPNRWMETPDERHRTTMTLVVPWQKQGETTWNTYYYQVPVNGLTEIVSNHSYTVNLNVGMLGSLSPETPGELTDISYRIVDWNNAQVDVNIKDTRYLVVEQRSFSAENEADITVPFFTSHPVTITDIEMDYDRFNYYSDGNGEVVTLTVDKDMIDLSNRNSAPGYLCTYSISKDDSGNSMLSISHPLKVWEPYGPDGEKVSLTGRTDAPSKLEIGYYKPSEPLEDAYSPYTFRVTFRHSDNPSFQETVTITQYPGMYIWADHNPGGNYHIATTNRNGNVNGTRSANYGYVYVNPTYETYNGQRYVVNSSDLGGVHGLTGMNQNPNMYVINVSVLNEWEKDYIIGDPRSSNINVNLSGEGALSAGKDVSNTWSARAYALYDGSNRVLTYYYPTIENDDETSNYANMIAPKIRIASSYGVTNPISRANARRRVASYQEQGCPAGRWRLPTLGEFKFITRLSAQGKIPELFTRESNYLTAQGIYQVTVNDKGEVSYARQTSSTTSVRAVYDEWYWENEETYQLLPDASGAYSFTWGDVPRNSTRNSMLINIYNNNLRR